MRLAIIYLACISLFTVAYTHSTKIADKEFLNKQKFLFEIVHRIDDPLRFEEWIKLGDQLIVDKSYYTQYDIHMEEFWNSYQKNVLLPRGEFFGSLVKTHHMQAWGLFSFFYYAKDWETFQRNVCWARMHINEGMFVNALTLAVTHREDFEGLILPYIYEIFPQYFFNSEFVFEAIRFDSNSWNKLNMYGEEYQDIYYKDNKACSQGGCVCMKDCKVWQWWKLMGLDKHWYLEENFIMRENISDLKSAINDVKMWWMPVDYSRDIDFYNEESALSYFTEDLGWNAFWYYFNMDYPIYLYDKSFGLETNRRGEFWTYIIHKVIARYYLERVSHGLSKIPTISQLHEVKHGYRPQLVSYNGAEYGYRENHFLMKNFGNTDMINKAHMFFHRIEAAIDSGYYKMDNETLIDLRRPDVAEYIGSMMQGNVGDEFDKYFFNYWYMYSHMHMSGVNFKDMQVHPNIFLNFETMMRDPLFFIVHRRIVDLFFRFKDNLKSYTKEELLFPGVQVKDVQVSELATYFDLFDYDVTNLLNDKMRFIDGQFVWDKTLLARQMRLNHKPFSLEISIESDTVQKVFIRAFIAPKYDEFDQVISLNDNRRNFLAIDKFTYELIPGRNIVKRDSTKYTFTTSDPKTYSELYHYVRLALEDKFEYPLNITRPHCSVPNRLLLPRGWEGGMPMLLFVMVTPYRLDHDQFEYSSSCGIGTGHRWIDDKDFAHPFDREIDEYGFFVPNMYFKNVKIYHYDNTEFYLNNNYNSYGKFDYKFNEWIYKQNNKT